MLTEIIKPENIRTTEHFWDTFGQAETEISARWVVRFLKDERSSQGWVPFPLAELQAYYNRTLPNERFSFNKLTSELYVQLEDKGDEGMIVKVLPRFVSALCRNPNLFFNAHPQAQ
jgi:hypothetical protein